MGGLRVGVGLVQRVAQPVAGEVDGLGGRLAVADADERGGAVAVVAVAVLVDVVADVEHEVEVVAGGDGAVGGEEAARVVAAGDERHPQRVGLARDVAGGLGATDVAELAERLEAVVVARVGVEARHVDLDRVVAVGRGHDGAVRGDAGEALVTGDLPAHGDRAAETAARSGGGLARPGRWRGAGPDDDGVGGGVAAGDPVAEDAPARGRRSGGGVEDAGDGEGGGGRGHTLEEGAPVEGRRCHGPEAMPAR